MESVVFDADSKNVFDLLKKNNVADSSIEAIMSRGLVSMDALKELKKEYMTLNSEMERMHLLVSRFGRHGIELVKIVIDFEA